MRIHSLLLTVNDRPNSLSRRRRRQLRNICLLIRVDITLTQRRHERSRNIRHTQRRRRHKQQINNTHTTRQSRRLRYRILRQKQRHATTNTQHTAKHHGGIRNNLQTCCGHTKQQRRRKHAHACRNHMPQRRVYRHSSYQSRSQENQTRACCHRTTSRRCDPIRALTVNTEGNQQAHKRQREENTANSATLQQINRTRYDILNQCYRKTKSHSRHNNPCSDLRSLIRPRLVPLNLELRNRLRHIVNKRRVRLLRHSLLQRQLIPGAHTCRL